MGGKKGAKKGAKKDVKKATVNGHRLLFNNAYPDRFHMSVASHLIAGGIKIQLDDIVEDVPAEVDPATALTKGGLKLSADLAPRYPEYTRIYQHCAETPCGSTVYITP
jgi:hypothetical protein